LLYIYNSYKEALNNVTITIKHTKLMKNKLSILLAAFLLCYSLGAQAQIITTIAGGDSVGLGDGGPAIDCELNQPLFTALDGLGNYYISDCGNNRVRKVSSTGIITTIAGTGAIGFSGDGGPATAAKITRPEGLNFDRYGNLYVADDGNGRVRKIDTAGIITTIAGTGTYAFSGDGGPATAAEIDNPHDVVVDSSGNVYIADLGNSCVRKVSADGIITTIAGIGKAAGNSGDGGPATAAKINGPYGITLDCISNIYIADYSNGNVRKITSDGTINTIAGEGRIAGYNGDSIAATTAILNGPCGVSVDNNGNLYVADGYNYRIRKIYPATTSGIITTIAGDGTLGYAGDGGLATLAEIGPSAVTLDNKGDIYITDFGNARIRYITNTLSVNTLSTNVNQISVFPNPCNESFTIKILSEINEPARIVITDMAGNRVKEMGATTNEPFTIQLDAPPGVYFVDAIIGGIGLSQRITIAK
jgi:sugar lactone lactonase YvrE